MSELPPDSLTYRTVITEYFLGLRGTGLMLSPLDLELVREWERRGLPVAVVCRGLRRGFEDALARRGPGVPAPRSLRSCRLAVEDEWRAYRSSRVGDAPAPPDEESVARRRLASARALLDAAAGTAPTRLRDAYRAARAALDAARHVTRLDEVERAITAADAMLLRHWLQALSRGERAALGPRCRARAGQRHRSMRRGAYREALRAHLGDAAREAGLLCLRGSV